MAGETADSIAEAAAAAAALAAQIPPNSTHDRPSPSTSLSHSIEKLDVTMATGQSNYNAWRFRLVQILKEKSLLTIVTDASGSTPIAKDGTAPVGGKSFSSDTESAEFLQKDNQAFTIINQNPKRNHCTQFQILGHNFISALIDVQLHGPLQDRIEKTLL